MIDAPTFQGRDGFQDFTDARICEILADDPIYEIALTLEYPGDTWIGHGNPYLIYHASYPVQHTIVRITPQLLHQHVGQLVLVGIKHCPETRIAINGGVSILHPFDSIPWMLFCEGLSHVGDKLIACHLAGIVVLGQHVSHGIYVLVEATVNLTLEISYGFISGAALLDQ